MMTDLTNIAEYWYNSGFESYSTIHSDDTGWGDKIVSQNYLKKYSLSMNSKSKWDDLQKSIFHLDRQLPDMIFKKDFEFITLLGGAMFEEKDFKQFKTCLRKLGERSFTVVQDTFGLESEQLRHSLNMNYPIDINWDELMDGNYISTILFESFYNHYYVFGNNGEWGMYVANDYVDESANPAGTPIRIIGFNPKYRDIFRMTFKIPNSEYCENVDYIPEEERPDLKDWVPKKYRK